LIEWHILGAGAMGSLVAHRMLERAIPCTLLHHREGRREQMLVDGKHTAKLTVSPLTALAPESIQHLLVTTKASQLAHAIALALPFLSKNAVIVCTANGLGFEQALQRTHPHHQLHRAVTTAGAFRDQENTVHVVSNGTTRVGLPGDRCESPPWFERGVAALETWKWETCIDQAIGEKFSINCVINALTADLRCRNGELLDGHKAGPELAALCEESEGPLKALGLWPQEKNLVSAATAVCESTSQNVSSMLQDRIAGRTTEIEFLNGELLRRAHALDFTLPLNQKLLQRLRKSEA